MPTFLVRLVRTVEQVTEIEVTAPNAEEAEFDALDRLVDMTYMTGVSWDEVQEVSPPQVEDIRCTSRPLWDDDDDEAC